MMQNQKPQIFLLNDPTVTRIVPSLAEEIGLKESIILLQIDFWIRTSNNYRDGRWWTYQSIDDMREKAFPYMGRSSINRCVKKLIDREYIIEGNYNTRANDRTRWFALSPDGLMKLKSITIIFNGESQNGTGRPKMGQGIPKWDGSSQNGTDESQNGTTLPETPTETTTKSTAESTTTPPSPIDDEKDNSIGVDELTPEIPNIVKQTLNGSSEKLIQDFGDEIVTAWCELAQTAHAMTGKRHVKNPGGWVRTALVKGWDLEAQRALINPPSTVGVPLLGPELIMPEVDDRDVARWQAYSQELKPDHQDMICWHVTLDQLMSSLSGDVVTQRVLRQAKLIRSGDDGTFMLWCKSQYAVEALTRIKALITKKLSDIRQQPTTIRVEVGTVMGLQHWLRTAQSATSIAI